MPETHSKIAVALAEALIPDGYITAQQSENEGAAVIGVAILRNDAAATIDQRLTEIREAYKPEELARCPVVTHHRDGPCAFCNTAAMREFILLPEDL